MTRYKFMSELKIKKELNYRFAKIYENRRCPSCNNMIMVTITKRNGDVIGKDMRCKLIGINDHVKYRIHKNGTCIKHT